MGKGKKNPPKKPPKKTAIYEPPPSPKPDYVLKKRM